MYNHQSTGDSIPRPTVQQDPEVTLFENFVSEEEVGWGSNENAAQQVAGNPTCSIIGNTYLYYILYAYTYYIQINIYVSLITQRKAYLPTFG